MFLYFDVIIANIKKDLKKIHKEIPGSWRRFHRIIE